MTDIVLLKYLFKTDWEPLEEVLRVSSADFSDIYKIDNETEVIQVVKQSSATLIMASIRSKDDLSKVLSLLKSSKKTFSDANIKISVLNFLPNKDIEAAFMKLGCQEVLDPNLKAKPLKFKMDFWKKALSVGSRKREPELNKQVKESKNNKTTNRKEEAQIIWKDALKVVDDMWITKNSHDAKRVLNRWMIKLMGPSPFVAQWSEVERQRGLWQFVFKDGMREKFHMEDGHWFFKGNQKPDFIWKENIWLISGQNFRLFYQAGESVSIRFRTNEETLEISKNSHYAQSREKAIIETFDQEVLVKRNQTNQSSTDVEVDAVRDGTLSEDIDGSDRLDGYIRGRNENDPNSTNKENSIGIDEFNDDPLEGSADTDDLGDPHYSGRVQAQRKSKKDPNAVDASSDSLFDEDGNAGIDDVGPQKYKGKITYSEEKRKSQYGGKSETDDLGDGYYGGIRKPGARASTDALDIEIDRDKKSRDIDELLPDGNADDPAGDVLPSIDNVADLRERNRKQTNLKLVSNLEATPISDEGVPLVNESAVVKVVLFRESEPAVELSAQIDDFFDSTLIVKMSSGSVQLGELLSLNIIFEYMKRSKRISLRGQCVEIQSEETESYITIEMNEQDKVVFEKFSRLYQLRQDHVREFLKAARGY